MNEAKNKPRVVRELSNEERHIAVHRSADVAVIAIRPKRDAAESLAIVGVPFQARCREAPAQQSQPLARVLDALAALGWNERQALCARPRVFARSGATHELVLDVEDGAQLGHHALDEIAGAIGVKREHLMRTFTLLERAERRERERRADQIGELVAGPASRARRG